MSGAFTQQSFKMRGLIFSLFMVLSVATFAQADTIFVIGADFGSTSEINDSTWQVVCTHPTDDLGQGFSGNGVYKNYLSFDVLGNIFRVDTVLSKSSSLTILWVIGQQNSIAPIGKGIVYRSPENSTCVPHIPFGFISNATIAKIHNHNVVNGCGGGGSGPADGDGIYGRDDTIPDNRVVLIEDQFDLRRLENGGIAGYNEIKFNDGGMRIGGYGNGSSISLFAGNASNPGRVSFSSSRFNFSTLFGPNIFTIGDNIAAFPQYPDAAFLGTSNVGQLIARSFSDAISDDADNALSVGIDNKLFVDVGGGGGGQVDTLIAGAGIAIDNTDPTSPVVSNTAPNVVQDAEDTAIDAIASLPASTNVQEGLSELATNYSALDQVVNALRILSGMPLLSENFGTFTGSIFPDNQTAKPLYQLIETELQAHLDSIAALRDDIETGGSTEIADGTTITGVGSVGDPFTANSDLINKQFGEYRHSADSMVWFPNLYDDSFNFSGAYTVNTGITAPAGTVVYLDFYIPGASSSTTSKRRVTVRVVARKRIDNSGWEKAYCNLDGENFAPSLSGVIGVDDNGYLTFSIGEVTDVGGRFEIVFSKAVGRNPISINRAAFDTYGSTDHSVTYDNFEGMFTSNLAFTAGASLGFLKEGVVTATTKTNTKNTNNVTAIVDRYIPGSESPTPGPGVDQSKGVYIGAEKTAANDFNFILGVPFSRSAQGIERMRITHEGDTGFGTSTPTQKLHVGGTRAALLLEPHDDALVGEAGLLYYDLSDNVLKGHNGTSLTRPVLATDTDASDGNFLSYNSAVDLYEPVTLTGGIGIDITSIGTDRGFALDLGELTAVATLSGNEFIANYDVTDGNQLTHIDTVANYIKNSIELTETNFSQNSNVSISADLPINHLTLEITSSSVENSTATLPTASSTYEGHIVKIWSIDTSGSFDNEVTATTIQNGAFTGSTINLNNFQATEISCIRTSVSNYRWVVTNQY